MAEKYPAVLMILDSICDAESVKFKALTIDTLSRWYGEIEFNRIRYSTRVFFVLKTRKIVEAKRIKEKGYGVAFRNFFVPFMNRSWFNTIEDAVQQDGFDLDAVHRIIVYDRGLKHFHHPRLTVYTFQGDTTMSTVLKAYREYSMGNSADAPPIST